jgi:4-amino-4-deoxy-L-arabinose transferase-like glycosyltransferase
VQLNLSIPKSIKEHYQIILITSIGFVLRLYMASTDPMLHDWDEKYHALVAKNMMVHPFRPMLYVHQYFSTDPYNWTNNHIWLHKQPLFMWQMALSMKLFGISELAIRLPSVAMGTLMIVLVYRICFLTTGNKLSSVISGLLLCCSNYYLNLISGRQGMDHNDVAFGFYILASIWAYAEYIHRASLKWVILIGVFAGCAVLNKWLTGLLVFAPWGIQSLLDLIQTKKAKAILPFIIGLLICIIVFAPWQFYILNCFPDLAKHEYAFNAEHIWKVVEKHEGDHWYYVNNFPLYFGKNVHFLIPLGLTIVLFKKSIDNKYKLLLILPTVIVFCFFSFIVQSKISGFFFIVAPMCIICIGIALQSIVVWFTHFRLWIAFILIGVSVHWNLSIWRINMYTRDTRTLHIKIHNTKIYKRLDNLIPENIQVVINANPVEHVDIMFYSNRLEAYHSDISEAEFKSVTKNNLPIAAFESREGHRLPEYIANYKYLYIIKAPVINY